MGLKKLLGKKEYCGHACVRAVCIELGIENPFEDLEQIGIPVLISNNTEIRTAFNNLLTLANSKFNETRQNEEIKDFVDAKKELIAQTRCFTEIGYKISCSEKALTLAQKTERRELANSLTVEKQVLRIQKERTKEAMDDYKLSLMKYYNLI